MTYADSIVQQIIRKLAVPEMRPKVLADVSDSEIRIAWLRLNQLYSAAKEAGRSIEDYVNAAVWVLAEMRKRGFEVDETLELVEQAGKLTKAAIPEKELPKLPKDVIIIPDFVSLIGSAVRDDNPNDVDVIFRAKRNNDDEFLLDAQNVRLPLRNVIGEAKIHYTDNPQGPHGDNIPVYDLVLRRKEKFDTNVVKEASTMPDWEKWLDKAPEGKRLDLGSGESRPNGFVSLDVDGSYSPDIMADLNNGIPAPDESLAVVRANHILEHLADKKAIMDDIYRVLKPDGIAIITIPSTAGEGAFAHPGHKSFWNKSSFLFLTDQELSTGRPIFEMEYLDERREGNLAYVDCVLRKPGAIEKLFTPFKLFTPPKPRMAGWTEFFTVDELWEWAEKRLPVASEPKWNGFRAIAEKQGDKMRLWFEGSPKVDVFKKIPQLKEAFAKIPGDWQLDLDLGIERAGKRLARPDLMRFNADVIEFAKNEKPVATIFNTPYIDKDISEQPFSERRIKLEKLLKGRTSNLVRLSPIKWAKNKSELMKAAKWAFGFPASEGVVAKSARGKYVEGATAEEAKIKKVAELKVIVLDVKRVKDSGWNYRGGLLPSAGAEWKNIRKFNDRQYIDLGWSFNTKVKAIRGEIITIEALELIPDEQKKTLVWLGANVADVDRARKRPYTTAQAIDIARRRSVLQKEEGVDDEGGTRAAAAREFWEKHWHEIFPSSGKGKFTYQHHWMGLNEDEAKLDEKALFDTTHALHGDMRLTGQKFDGGEMWGPSIFLGKATDNKKVGGDRLVVLPQDDNLQIAFKLAQPIGWLTIAREKPHVAKPSEPGATSKTWAKFFEWDYGDYDMGVWREHLMEIFLKGDKLKQRFLLEFVPFGNRRIWIIDKPKDQTPYAESRDLAKIIDELRRKRQRWLIWAKPGLKPVKIDVDKITDAEIERIKKRFEAVSKSGEYFEREITISKLDDEKQIASFIVTDPYQVDAQGDWPPPADVEAYAYDWLEKSRVIGESHKRKAQAVPVASWLIPYPTPTDYKAAMSGAEHDIYEIKLGNDFAKSGSHIIDIRFKDDLWKRLKSGEFNAVSIGGKGVRKPVSRSAMPKVRNVIRVGV